MKLKTRYFLKIIVTILLFWTQTVQADSDDDYYIKITNDEAVSQQELEITEHTVSEGDVVSHKIFVENQTNSAHSVKLTNIEIVKSSILLDKVNFEFVAGKSMFSFNKNTLTQNKNKDLFTLGAKKTGEMTLKMSVNGKMDNSYQGTSFTIRYTFEVVNLNSGGSTGKTEPRVEVDNGGDNSFPETIEEESEPVTEISEESEPLPETSEASFGNRFIPNTIEGKLFIASIIEILLILILLAIGLYLVLKKRKKMKNDTK